MIKKLLATSVLTSAFLFATPNAEAHFSLPNNELQLAVLAKASEKKAIVLATMHLKKDNKEAFGKLYDEYQVELMKGHMKMGALIANYASNYKQMTNETSDKLLVTWAKIEDAELALKKQYMLKFRAFLPSADVIRYFQIENRFKVMHQAKIMNKIPLATPPKLSTGMAIELSETPKKETTVAK